MHSLEKIIRNANSTGRRALIPFLTAGFPDRERFWNIVAELDANGADIIEIGVPFSDPVADGPAVEAASVRALSEGITLAEILGALEQNRKKIAAGIVLMGYYNPFLQYGLQKFAADAMSAGVDGLIVPDLPLDEDAPLRGQLDSRGIALIPLVGPNTSLERMRQYAGRAIGGYAYVVSIMGTTGVRKSLEPGLVKTMERARQAFSLPLALGFGLSSQNQIAGLPPGATPDALIFGSSLLRHIDSGGAAADFMRRWTENY